MEYHFHGLINYLIEKTNGTAIPWNSSIISLKTNGTAFPLIS